MKSPLEVFERQNKIARMVIGTSPLSETIRLLTERFESPFSQGLALSGIESIAKSLVNRTHESNMNSIVTNGGTLGSTLKMFEKQQKAINLPLTGIFSTLDLLSSLNKPVHNSLSNLAVSNLTLTEHLSQFARATQIPQLEKFNAVNVAIGGISNAFLGNIQKTKNWDDLEVVEEVNQVLIARTKEIVDKVELTSNELSQMLSGILVDLQDVKAQTKNAKSSNYIDRLIGIIGILLTIYSLILSKSDITNEEALDSTANLIQESENRILAITREEAKKDKKELIHVITSEFSKLRKLRTASTDVNLRKCTKKRGEKIGIVSKGQEVTVLEIHGKYLLIFYLDDASGNPKSGYAYKKYFKK